MKKLASILLMVVLAFNLTACSSSEDSLSDLMPDSFSDTDVLPEDGYAEGQLGSVMRTYFFNYTVNSAYLCDEYSGYTPAEGKTLLVADVTVKNTFDEAIEMYDTDFQVQWGSDEEDAYDYPITLYVDPVSDEQLPGTYELAAGEEVTGLLVFEVAAGSTDFSISYLELFSDDTEGDLFFVYFTAEEQ